MGSRFLSLGNIDKLLDFANKPYRPKAIIDLKTEIEAEIRATEIDASIKSVIDQVRIQKIVEMKFRLDDLYIDWAEGKIS